ncbi:cupin domain-containing protein [Streptomyces sp. NPDC050416]|uniref:cupin domain-containing protein n=1 Tax=Streptomyces sp. NPDC050416 TaxID=3365611 RepID=UPI0037BA0A22
MTATEGLLVPPGQGRAVAAPADVGAHVHTRSEELFHVLEGELDVLAFEPRVRTPDNWQHGSRPRATGWCGRPRGTVIVVPQGCPHAFANPTDEPAKTFFQASPPPDHERYFEELLEILGNGGPPDHAAIEELWARYDIEQLTPLRHR